MTGEQWLGIYLMGVAMIGTTLYFISRDNPDEHGFAFFFCTVFWPALAILLFCLTPIILTGLLMVGMEKAGTWLLKRD